jgi:AcrR family transcriptional regulator
MPPIKKIIRDVIDAHQEHHRARHAAKDEFKQSIKAVLSAAKSPRGDARGTARAMGTDDKEARRSTILDAAERLFMQNHALANVADVAEAAGLAKGTVYLYFQTKEEIYFALHLRHVEGFFTTLITRLADPRAFDFLQMAEMAREHMIADRTYMPLCATCMGFSEKSVPVELYELFDRKLIGWITEAAAGLEKHFPKLPKGEGVRLLKHSYAMMIGLYHLLGTRGPEHPTVGQNLPGIGSYEDEAMIALDRYWSQVTGEPMMPIPKIIDTNSTSSRKA